MPSIFSRYAVMRSQANLGVKVGEGAVENSKENENENIPLTSQKYFAVILLESEVESCAEIFNKIHISKVIVLFF